MLHERRRFSVWPVASALELAGKLTGSTWCGCQGFSLGGYLFLNDSTGPDGAQEFAVVKPLDGGRFLQVESVTFSWCSESEALKYVTEALGGRYDGEEFAREVRPRIETAGEHGTCFLCA